MEISLYQTAAMRTALPTARNLTYMTLNLAAEAGEVAGKAAKAKRDDWDNERLIAEITPEIGDVLWQLAGVCDVLGISLQGAAEANLEKLASRQKRGQITGSGDNR